jgi:hypothetical protein
MHRLVQIAAFLLIRSAPVHAQWTLETSNTTADLRGIHSIGNGVAWASGTNGTVLRTEDGGYVWQSCSIPPGAEKLDFRGIQAFDANTAIVMSSGKGDLSRLYKTVDGCNSWKLLFTNPDPDGFWDGLIADKLGSSAVVVGDPVDGRFKLYASINNGLLRWYPFEHPERAPKLQNLAPHSTQEGLFAASNSILCGDAWNGVNFVTGGTGGSWFYSTTWHSWPTDFNFPTHQAEPLPLAIGATAGAFSFQRSQSCPKGPCAVVVVGGDYTKPNEVAGTAAYSGDGGKSWRSPRTLPHGYRSSVAYDVTTKTWITVGPNGTDISTDDGKNWRPVHPDPARHEPPDADRNWNAISLPFVVGPKGRIGKLNPAALKP